MNSSGNATSLYGNSQIGDIWGDILGTVTGGGGDIINNINNEIKDATGLDIKGTYEDAKEVAGDINKYNDMVKNATGVDVLKTGQNLIVPGSTAITGGSSAPSTGKPPASGGSDSLVNYATTPVNIPGGTTATSGNTGVAGGINTAKTAAPSASSTTAAGGGNSRENMLKEEVARQMAVNERKSNPNTGVTELDGNWLTEKMYKVNKGGYIGATAGFILGGFIPGISGFLVRAATAGVGCYAGHKIYEKNK